MVATTVTPEMVRVVFLLRICKSFLVSFVVKRDIKSEFDGMLSRWYLPVVFILSRLAS